VHLEVLSSLTDKFGSVCIQTKQLSTCVNAVSAQCWKAPGGDAQGPLGALIFRSVAFRPQRSLPLN
jgi:hypothetical protein